jgi:hypothetical protein
VNSIVGGRIPNDLTRRSHDVLALAAVTAVITILFIDVLIAGAGFFTRDLYQYYFPAKHVIRETILGGELPVWNRFFAAGQPMAANPEYEVWYPLQALILLPSYELGFQLHILVHLYIAAFGAYFLMRAFGRSVTAALFVALTFALGGPMLSLINLLPMLFCVAWIPWIVLAVHRHAENPAPRRFAAAALLLGLQMLAAEPSSLMQTWGLIVLYAAIRKSWRTLMVLPAGVAVGAVQLLPALDHVRDSVRSLGFSYDAATSWSMPPVRLIELAFPRVFGELGEHGRWYWGSALYPRDGAPFLFSIYAGALLIALLVAGVQRRRAFVFGAVWAALAVLVAFGSHAPLFGWLRALPLVDSLRYPEKFFLTFLLLAIFYAGFVLDRLIEGDRAVARRTLIALVVIAVAAGIAAMTHPQLPDPAMLAKWRNGWLHSLMAAGAFAVIIPLRRPLLLIAAVIAELAILAGDVAPRQPRSYFAPPPVLASIQTGGGRLFHEAQWDPQVRATPELLLPMTPARWGIPMALEVDYDSTSLIPTSEMLKVMLAAPQRRDLVAAMSNVTLRAERGDPIRVVPMGPNPRYYFSDQLVRLTDARAIAGALINRDWSRRVAFVGGPLFPPAAGRVLAVRESASRATVDVECAGDALLIASVTFHKYWRATIDGAPASIERVNVAYQGIRVPRGRHRIELRYRNDVLLVSMAISAAAILVLTSLALRRGWR